MKLHPPQIAPRALFALLLLPLLQGCLIVEGGFEREIYLQSGTATRLHVGIGGCCYFILPLNAPTLWFITPITEGVTLNPVTGRIFIGEDVPNGTSFTVHAGSRAAEVFVYEPAQNPLANRWHEVGQFNCETGVEFEPEDGIREIIFTPSGNFSVTWHPFEVYKDYWGTYTFDLETGALELTIENGNNIPPDFDGIGAFQVDDDGTIILTDLWFGTRLLNFDPGAEHDAPACGHRLGTE